MQRLLMGAAAGVVLFSMMSVAQPRERMRERMDLPRRDMLHELLNLSDEQHARLDNLQHDHQKKQIDLRAKLQSAQLDLRKLYRADKPDRSAIEKQTRAIADLRLQASMNRVDHYFGVLGILTPEQQKVWKEHAGDRPGPRRGDSRGPRDMMRHSPLVD